MQLAVERLRFLYSDKAFSVQLREGSTRHGDPFYIRGKSRGDANTNIREDPTPDLKKKWCMTNTDAEHKRGETRGHKQRGSAPWERNQYMETAI